jgi:hypothetical protein
MHDSVDQAEVGGLLAASGIRVPTPEEIEAGMRLATRQMVEEQIAWAKRMDRNQRGTKHRPGSTKKARRARAVESRKRNRAAGKSRRKNRRK